MEFNLQEHWINSQYPAAPWSNSSCLEIDHSGETYSITGVVNMDVLIKRRKGGAGKIWWSPFHLTWKTRIIAIAKNGIKNTNYSPNYYRRLVFFNAALLSRIVKLCLVGANTKMFGKNDHRTIHPKKIKNKIEKT